MALFAGGGCIEYIFLCVWIQALALLFRNIGSSNLQIFFVALEFIVFGIVIGSLLALTFGLKTLQLQRLESINKSEKLLKRDFF